MTSGASERRPPQVTFAGWLVVGGSIFVLLGAFEAMSSLRTLETRAMIEQFLDEPPGSSLGIGYERTVQLRRIAILVLAACATAAAILGIFALRRDKGARIGLTVVAPPLFVAGSVAGGFASAVVTVSIVMLWLEPARSWFARRPLPERFRLPRDGAARSDRPAAPGGSDPSYGAQPPASSPPTYPSYAPEQPPAAERPGSPYASGSPYAQPAAYQGFGEAHGRPVQPPWEAAAPTRRPGAVLAAALATWVASGLLALLMLAQVVLVLANPDLLMDEVRRTQPDVLDQGVTTDYLLGATVAIGAVVVIWCVAACVLAALAMRGRGWARVLLLVSASVAGGICLLGTLVAPPLVVGVPATAIAVVALLRREVSAWFAAQDRARRA